MLSLLDNCAGPARRRWRTWAHQEPALAGLDRLQIRSILLDDTEPVDYDRRDELLAALVRLARADQDAGTLLVACLLPGIKARLRLHAAGLDRDEAAAMFVAALWRRIGEYPLGRRPRKIATNLLLDATHDFIAYRDRQRAWTTNTVLSDRDHEQPAEDTCWSLHLIWHQAVRAGVLHHWQATLIHATRLAGLPLLDVAQLLGINYENTKKARRRAELRWANWWSPQDRAPAA